tara:strand:+ start:161 stop:571 length:411 start_codon:yes stop_codon:yes gene_type:complete
MYEYEIKEIVKIIDGDTIDVVFDLGFSLFKKERVRLAGIDTPESRTRDPEEKILGLEAKDRLTEMLENASSLVCRTEKEGKYGRILGWIHADGAETTLNQTLIDTGYAWAYEGGKKNKSHEDFKALYDIRYKAPAK